MASVSPESLAQLELVLAGTNNELKLKSVQGLASDLEKVEKIEIDSQSLELLSSILKSTLKSTNTHIATAALACLQHYFPLLVPNYSSGDGVPVNHLSFTLRHAFMQLLPLHQLTDSKERVRELAREALVAAAKTALRLNHLANPGGSSAAVAVASKDKETPWTFLSKSVQESAFQSKNAKAREQALLYLAAIRDHTPSPSSSDEPIVAPLRPFLPLLPPLLADPDPQVRALSLSTTISVFSSQNTSAAARTDWKKTLVAASSSGGVNKKVVDTILAAILGGGTSTDLPVDAGSSAASSSSSPIPHPHPRTSPTLSSSSHPKATSRASLPPTATSRSVSTPITLPSTAFPSDPSTTAPPSQASDFPPVYVASLADLAAEFESMKPAFEGKETEFNWIERDKSILRLRGMVKGGVVLQEEFVEAFLAGLKSVLDGILKTASSLRTTVAVSALTLISELASSLGHSLDPLLDPLLSHCLSMAGQTKKIVANASQASATALITHSNYHLRTLQLLLTSMSDKIVLARTFISAHVVTFLSVHGKKSKVHIEHTGGLALLEGILKKGLGDANAVVKENSRKAFWEVSEIWPKTAENVLKGLDSTSRKQLEKADPSKKVGAMMAKVGAESTTAKARPSARQFIARAKAAAKPEDGADDTEEDGQRAPPDKAVSSVGSNKGSSSPKTSAPPNSSISRIAASPRASPLRSVSSPVAGGSTPISHRPSPFAPSPSSSPHQSPTPRTNPRFSPPVSRQNTPLRPTTPPLTPPTQSVGEPDPNLLKFASPFLVDEQDSSLDFESRESLSSTSPSQRRLPPSTSESTPGLVLPIPDPIVDDALKGQAAQAEQAAQRLLELADSDTEDESKMRGLLNPVTGEAQTDDRSNALQKTPIAKRANNGLLRGGLGDVFEDSPDVARRGLGGDGIGAAGGKNNWWMKKTDAATSVLTSVEASGEMVSWAATPDSEDRLEEIRSIVKSLHDKTITIQGFKELISLSRERPVRELDDSEERNPLIEQAEKFWQGSSTRFFDKIFSGLVGFLKSEETLENKDTALVLLKELVVNQCPCFSGEELEVYTILFHLRENTSRTTIAAVEAIAEIFCNQLEPLYGLGLLTVSLNTYLSIPNSSAPIVVDPTKAKSFALGLKLLGKFFPRLPSEITEEELPKAKSLIKAGLNDTRFGDLRRAAVMALVDAHKSLQDEERLYVMVGGLGKDQTSLLAYFIHR